MLFKAEMLPSSFKSLICFLFLVLIHLLSFYLFTIFFLFPRNLIHCSVQNVFVIFEQIIRVLTSIRVFVFF